MVAQNTMHNHMQPMSGGLWLPGNPQFCSSLEHFIKSCNIVEEYMRQGKVRRRQGLSYAAVTLLITALPVIVVLGMGMGEGITTAEVVRMNKKKKTITKGGTHCCPRHHPTHHCGHGRGQECGHWHWRQHGSGGGGCIVVVVVVVIVVLMVVVVVVVWVVRLNELNVGSNLVMQPIT